MEKKENIYNLLLVGETGTGKSSLGNFIVGEEVFEVSDDADACTKNTIRKISKLDPQISVLDTPGLQDSKGRDKVHYDQMVKIINEMKHLHLIVIVLNFTNPRFTLSIQYMIKFLCNLFPKNFAKHVAIVFTHYDHDYQMKINKKKGTDPTSAAKKKYVPQIMQLIKETTNEEEFKAPPVYFMDSYVQDDNSKENLFQLIALAKLIKQPIEDIRQNCDIKYKKEEQETEERTEVKEEGDQIVTYIRKFQRTKYTDYNNNVTYGDWKCIDTRKTFRDKPVKIIERYYERSNNNNSGYKDYHEIYKKVQEEKSKNPNKTKNRTGTGNYHEGICEEKNYPKIKLKKYECEMDGKSFRKVEKKFDEYFSGVIVGFKIEENWKDGTNGTWEINDCLLSHNVNAKFVSQTFRGQSFTLKIYEMEDVEKNNDDDEDF